MNPREVAAGCLLLLVSSTLLVAGGVVDRPLPVFALSVSPLAVAGLAAAARKAASSAV